MKLHSGQTALRFMDRGEMCKILLVIVQLLLGTFRKHAQEDEDCDEYRQYIDDRPCLRDLIQQTEIEGGLQSVKYECVGQIDGHKDEEYPCEGYPEQGDHELSYHIYSFPLSSLRICCSSYSLMNLSRSLSFSCTS